MSFWQKLKDAFYGPNQPDKQQYIISTNDSNVPNQKPRIDAMSDFSHVLSVEDIAVDVDVDTSAEALKYLSNLAEKLDPNLDAETIYGQFLLREKESATDLGDGVAIPHAKLESVSNLKMFVIKLSQPIVWDEENQVDTVIAFLIPDPERGYQHVSYLSTVSRLLLKKDFRISLQKAKNSASILKLFK